MKKQPKLTIILPVYNTEKYLDKCITSILNNTFQDFELIVINDGTPDESEKIILEFKEKYGDKIIYVSKENTGLSDTRNLGISMATGEYISFIDSDDYIEPIMFEKMIEKLKEHEFDVIACDVKLVYENSSNEKVISSNYGTDIYDRDQIKKSMVTQYPVVWNKIYKASVIKDITFSKGVWYEDIEFMLKLYPKLTSIGVVKEPLYNYLQRENSITYTYNDKLYDIINNMTNVIEYYNKNDLFDEYKEELEYLFARYAIATFIKRLAKCGEKNKYKEGVRFALDKVNNTFPEYKQNNYLKKVGLKGLYIKHFNNTLANINFIAQNNKKYN